MLECSSAVPVPLAATSSIGRMSRQGIERFPRCRGPWSADRWYALATEPAYDPPHAGDPAVSTLV